MDTSTDGPSAPEALVVEHDPAIREQLISALARQGYDVAACESLGEGRTRYRRQPLIVAHVNGKSDELQGFVEFVRRESGEVQPYILAIGGLGDTIRARAAQFGLNDFLSTPLDEIRLLSRLSAISRWLACRAHPESAFSLVEACAGSADESEAGAMSDSFDWKAVVPASLPASTLPISATSPPDAESSAPPPESTVADIDVHENQSDAEPSAESPAAPGDSTPVDAAETPAETEPPGKVEAPPPVDALIESLPMAAAVFDRKSRYVASNHRFRNDFGLDRASLDARTHHEIFPDLHDEWRRLFDRALDGHSGRIHADLLERADGTSDIVSWEVAPWRDHDGVVLGFILSQQIITEQKRLERRNRFEGNVTRSLFESTSVPVLLAGLDGRLLRSSPAARRLAGLQPTVAGRVHFWELYPDHHGPAERERFDQTVKRLDESGAFEFDPADIVISGPTPLRLVWTASPHLSSGGRIEAILVVGSLIPEVSPPDAPAPPADAPAPNDTVSASRAVDNLACGLVILDRNGDIIFSNKALEGLLGIGFDGVESFEDWLAKVAPSDADHVEVMRQWREHVWRRQAVRTFSLLTADRLLKEIEIRPRLARDGSLLLALNDVTDQRRAEDALRASEAKFRALFNQSPCPIAVTDHTGAIVDANPSFEKLSGTARADLRRSTLDSFLEFDRGPVDEVNESPAGPGSVPRRSPARAVLTSRDGCSRPVDLDIFPIRNAAGETFLNACYFQLAGISDHDGAIHERDSGGPVSKNRLAEATALWRGIAFDAAPAALIVTDLRGRITEANRAAAAFFGFAGKEINGTPLYQLFMPHDPDGFSRTISAEIKSAGRWQADTSFARIDGATGCCRVQLFPVTEDGAAALLCIVEPLTADTPPATPVPPAQPLPRSVRHALRNHLQLVGSLLNLEQRKLADPRARAHLEATQQRVGAISLVEEQILSGTDPQEIDLPRIIEGLAETLRRETSPPVTFELDPARIETNLALPLTLVANEFLAVALHRHQTDAVTIALRVADSSALLDMQWNPAGPTSSNDAARFETARLLIDRVGGTLTKTDDGSHWEAVFHFPDRHFPDRPAPAEHLEKTHNRLDTITHPTADATATTPAAPITPAGPSPQAF